MYCVVIFIDENPLDETTSVVLQSWLEVDGAGKVQVAYPAMTKYVSRALRMKIEKDNADIPWERFPCRIVPGSETCEFDLRTYSLV